MFGKECDIVAVLTPRAGKHDRVIELLSSLTKAVEEKEPGVMTFHLYEDFDNAADERQLVLVEKYENKAAYNAYSDLPEFVVMHECFKKEDLMEKPILIKSVKPILGFSRPVPHSEGME